MAKVWLLSLLRLSAEHTRNKIDNVIHAEIPYASVDSDYYVQHGA